MRNMTLRGMKLLQMKLLMVTLMALVGGLAMGCDDAETSNDVDMAGGGGGEGGEGGEGGGAVEVETFLFTSLTMTEPAAAASLLNGALTTNLNSGSLVVLIQMEGWAGGMPIMRGGAGELVEGADTPDDISDDVFTWLTDGTCANDDGTETPCSVDISEKVGVRDGDNFVLTGGEIAIYAKDLKLIIPIRNLGLTGTRSGIDASASLTGVITQADAVATRLQLTPGGAVQTLEEILGLFSVMTDTEFEGQPAYTFEGSFDSELIVFTDE